MLSLLRHRTMWRVTCTWVIELVIIASAFVVYVGLRSFLNVGQIVPPSASVLGFGLLAAVVTQAALWAFGLYSRQVIYSPRPVFRALLGALILATLLLVPVVCLFHLVEGSLADLTVKSHLSLLALLSLSLGAERHLVLKLLGPRSELGPTLIVGGGDGTAELIREVLRDGRSGIELAGILVRDESRVGTDIESVPIIGTLQDIEAKVEERAVWTILLALPCDDEELPLDFLLECRASGREVIDIATLYETLSQKVLLEKMDAFSVLFARGIKGCRLRLRMKEAVERALAFVLLVACAPLLLLVYFSIRLHLGEPVILAVPTIGQGGKEFVRFCFRSRPISAAPDPATARDRLGAFLEWTRLSRLPMLWNVLRGEMSFVGPRPEDPESFRAHESTVAGYRHRLSLKPGWTGWAQVAGRPAQPDFDSREDLRYDLYYLKHLSLSFDILILLSAMRGLISGRSPS